MNQNMFIKLGICWSNLLSVYWLISYLHEILCQKRILHLYMKLKLHFIFFQVVKPADGSDYVIDYYGAVLNRLSVNNDTYIKPPFYE